MTLSTKHGGTCLALPSKPFVMDLTIYMDISRNPGPTPVSSLGLKENCTRFGPSRSSSSIDLHIAYSKGHLYSLRKSAASLFQSLIVAVFTYAIEVWGCAFYSKYLSRIDKLFARCYKLGYCLRQYSILDIRRNRDMKLWQRISSTNTALSDLLPPQRTRQMRTRSHNYILPKVQTSRFKSVFVNRCLFNVINN